MNRFCGWLKTEIFRILCLLLAAYFFIAFHSDVGFPAGGKVSSSGGLYLVLSMFFFLVPFAKRLKLGKLFEYEAKIDELKGDVDAFKSEMRQTVALQANLINAVSNTVSQNININVPWGREAEKAKEDLDETIPESPESTTLEDEIRRILIQSEDDPNYALAKLRMELESELRRILGYRTKTADPTQMKGKFLSAGPLFKKFVARFPKYAGARSSFDFILSVCNAAIHGQRVSDKYAHEALYVGVRLLEEFRQIQTVQDAEAWES
ncbi:hypothetical protein [Zhongshania sp. BJYM1]|uniref:hypothetical protein n=1 Tax=Zhongshania aquatica TaxID=2965069 RepID=UPI0022B56248|nr:hypothetical protein [Marortus sp. BJYM1]